jgi:hypothetical protein
MPADYHDIIAAQKTMETVRLRMDAMTADVGKARRVVEFSGDWRKAALADVAALFIKAGETSSAADTKARADAGYQSRLHELQDEYQEAQTTLATWDALHCAFDSARSILSARKETVKQIG